MTTMAESDVHEQPPLDPADDKLRFNLMLHGRPWTVKLPRPWTGRLPAELARRPNVVGAIVGSGWAHAVARAIADHAGVSRRLDEEGRLHL